MSAETWYKRETRGVMKEKEEGNREKCMMDSTFHFSSPVTASEPGSGPRPPPLTSLQLLLLWPRVDTVLELYTKQTKNTFLFLLSCFISGPSYWTNLATNHTVAGGREQTWDAWLKVVIKMLTASATLLPPPTPSSAWPWWHWLPVSSSQNPSGLMQPQVPSTVGSPSPTPPLAFLRNRYLSSLTFFLTELAPLTS